MKKTFDLNELKSHLPEYLEIVTKRRTKNMYNCPICGSGTKKNGTPALSLYNNGRKWKCHSCGAGGSIIDLYLYVNQMETSRRNVAIAIKELARIYAVPECEQFMDNYLRKNEENQRKKYHRKRRTTKSSQTINTLFTNQSRTHIYYNEDGSIFGKKDITSLTDGRKMICWWLYNPETKTYTKGLNGQKAPLYNANVLHNMGNEGTIFITEGEKDADTLSHLDDIPATTIPNGAGFHQWLDLYNDGLQGKDIIILTDNDEAGRKYGNTVATNVVSIANSVKIIPATAIWNKCPEKGDISDIVQALGADEATQLLADAIHNAPFYTPESRPELLRETEQFADAPIQHKIEYTFVRLSDVKPEKQEFLWNPYIPIGEITVMYAAGGTGKSYATIGIAADITQGRSLPKYGEEQKKVNPEKVLFISGEDNPSIILNRMKEAGGNPDNCYVLKTPKTRAELNTESFLLPQDKDDTARIEAFAHLLEQICPKLVIIDPWSVYIGGNKNMNKANDVRAITNVLTVLAKEYNCAILIVAHVNKMPQTENANNAVSGSTALIDSARSALCIRSFGANSDRRVIIQTKSNYQKKAKSVCYKIVNQGENRTARFEWDDFSDLTEDDLTKSARTGKSLSDIENDNSDDEENRETAIEVIKSLAVYGKSINISYDRFREELKKQCGEDFLPKHPQKFMGSLASKLRACGIRVETKKEKVRGLLLDGTCDAIPKRGFSISSMTDGGLMASAMPY